DETYFLEKYSPRYTSAPKIRWLGQKNVLGALFYDLWKGQDYILPTLKEIVEKGVIVDKVVIMKDVIMPPLIGNKRKSDLEEFLESNFTDENGEPFDPGSFSDYLNKSASKEESSRPKFPTRIKLFFEK